MPVLTNWNLEITVDDALRGQGANAETIRKRSPRIVAITEKALTGAKPLFRPIVIYKELEVIGVQHDRLLLEGGNYLQSAVLVSHLASAQQVAVVVCTVSEEISRLASDQMKENIVYGLALDGIGSVAVELLSNDVCKWLDEKAAAKGWRTSIPLSPGDNGWPLDEGQKQLFKCLGQESDAVILTENFLMEPVKSLSFVVGMGEDIQKHGSTCDFCGLRNTCQYKTHQESQH